MNGTPHRARAHLAAALLLALCGLTACGGGDGGTADPSPTPKFSSSAPPTTASTTTSPVGGSSSAAPEETPQAFIRRWTMLEKQMENDGDSSVYRSITSSCKPCTDTADQVDQIYSNGGHIETGGRSVLMITPIGRSASSATFRVLVSVAPTTYTESATGAQKSFPGGRSTYEVELRRVANAWTLADYSKFAK